MGSFLNPIKGHPTGVYKYRNHGGLSLKNEDTFVDSEKKEETYRKSLISVRRNWLLLRPNERKNNHSVISVRFGP